MDEILDIEDEAGVDEDGLSNTVEFGGIFVRNRRSQTEVCA